MVHSIIFSHPTDKTFPNISVTGGFYAPAYKYCPKKYSSSIIPAITPKKHYNLCLDFNENGALGCLISGDFDESGRVPLPYETIHEIKRDTSLLINLYTGLLTEDDALCLRLVKPDAVSFDIVGDKTFIRDIYGLRKNPEDYLETLDYLLDNKVNVVPHVFIGLAHGTIRHEVNVYKMLKERKAKKVVLLLKRPEPGERIDVGETVATMKKARDMFPTLILGSMRPRIKEVEEAATMFDVVMRPSAWLKRKAIADGLDITESNLCPVLYDRHNNLNTTIPK